MPHTQEKLANTHTRTHTPCFLKALLHPSMFSFCLTSFFVAFDFNWVVVIYLFAILFFVFFVFVFLERKKERHEVVWVKK